MPKTPQRDQWKVRLDRYHQFVVERLMDVNEVGKSAILERMIVGWVSEHGDQIRQARASYEDWEKARETDEEEG